MSADIRMVDWQTEGRAFINLFSSANARYLCGALTDEEWASEIQQTTREWGETTRARSDLINRGYWDHRPKHDR